MAEQAALAQDVLDFADALGLGRFALAGFDWGNRAACIVSIVAPERVVGQVSIVSGAPMAEAKARAKTQAAPSTDEVDGRSSGSPRSTAMEVETTPGCPHGSMRPKSSRSTLTLRAMPW